MARRSGVLQAAVKFQRDMERQRAAQVRAQSHAVREAERAQRDYERAVASDEKERQRLYLASRQALVDLHNEELQRSIDDLGAILAATLDVDDYFDLEQLKEPHTFPPFDPGHLGLAEPAPALDAFLPAAPTGVTRFLPHVKQRHAVAVAAAEQEYVRAQEAHAAREAARQQSLAAERDRVAAQHAAIEEFTAAFAAGDPAAIVSYFTLVLESSVYPEGFPEERKLAYVPESRQLVVEYDLPPFAVVPEAGQYKYVKARDEIAQTARAAAPRRALYASVVAQITVRTVHELFEADRAGHIDTLVFNGYVEAIDPSTGRPQRTCLVTLRTTRDTFAHIDLRHVEPIACLKGLSASVSKSPSELAPVRPVLEFSMVDPRFVQEADVLAGLDQRANLLDLTPGEFESLITNLFHAMGLEARQTQASRDGGVDCVAYDPRPIFGGKVVIQAKRYKHTVGVSAVRDLFGTVQNEGASKGILVTTSGYGKAAYDFVQNKPLELLDGANLLYLLKEHAGLDAKIEAPEGWRDPVSDAQDESRGSR